MFVTFPRFLTTYHQVYETFNILTFNIFKSVLIRIFPHFHTCIFFFNFFLVVILPFIDVSSCVFLVTGSPFLPYTFIIIQTMIDESDALQEKRFQNRPVNK